MKQFFTMMLMVVGMMTMSNAQSACGCYKEYVAVLNQSGTDAPVATVLKNNTGLEIVWVYDSPGNYNGVGWDGVDPAKVVVLDGDGANHLILVNTAWNGENVNITAAALNVMFDPIPSDDLLQWYPVMVRIYQ